MAKKRRRQPPKKRVGKRPSKARSDWGYYLFRDSGVSVAYIGKANEDGSVEAALFGVDTWRDGLIVCHGRRFEANAAGERDGLCAVVDHVLDLQLDTVAPRLLVLDAQLEVVQLPLAQGQDLAPLAATGGYCASHAHATLAREQEAPAIWGVGVRVATGGVLGLLHPERAVRGKARAETGGHAARRDGR